MVSCSSPKPMVWRKNSRAMFTLGTSVPRRKASPFGKPSTPTVLPTPNPCHIKPCTCASAPCHNRAPANTSSEMVSLNSPPRERLFGPEYEHNQSSRSSEALSVIFPLREREGQGEGEATGEMGRCTKTEMHSLEVSLFNAGPGSGGEAGTSGLETTGNRGPA